MNIVRLIVVVTLTLVVIACTSLINQNADPITTQKIQLNQLGYLPNARKVAIVPNVNQQSFRLVSLDTGKLVYKGKLTSAKSWQAAGNRSFKVADFSSVIKEGRYFLKVNGVADSAEFDIASNVYDKLHDSALKSYYFNRSSLAIESPYGQQWSRAEGHADNEVKVHASAASTSRPESSMIESTKGWYDAGDYGKYVVNSGIATYTLLASYEHFPTFYQNRNTNIPESNDNIPDILNEAKWNIDWLATMQDTDGSVYHKLTTLAWPGKEMPVQDKRERFVIGKSTSAALDYAAVLAMGTRIYAPYNNGQTQHWLSSAELAWQWAVSNPNLVYSQPDDVSSGEYGDDSFNDEFSWAAAELFITTQKPKYLEQYLNFRSKIDVPSWSYVAYLATSTLLIKGQAIIPPVIYQKIKSEQLALADNLVQQYNDNGYQVPLVESDFVWGSNSVALNKALILMQAHRLSSKQAYKNAALSIIDYVLGRNPTDYSYVTGFGSKSPLFPHHRVSVSDGIVAPIPGMLVGGPHSGKQDGCDYQFDQPAITYIDDWCSYATNEVAINWNAPLVYVLAAILAD